MVTKILVTRKGEIQHYYYLQTVILKIIRKRLNKSLHSFLGSYHHGHPWGFALLLHRSKGIALLLSQVYSALPPLHPLPLPSLARPFLNGLPSFLRHCFLPLPGCQSYHGLYILWSFWRLTRPPFLSDLLNLFSVRPCLRFSAGETCCFTAFSCIQVFWFFPSTSLANPMVTNPLPLYNFSVSPTPTLKALQF